MGLFGSSMCRSRDARRDRLGRLIINLVAPGEPGDPFSSSETYTTETLALRLALFTHKTAVVHALCGRGEEGVGEDMGYDADSMMWSSAAGPGQPLTGHFTLASVSTYLEGLALFP